jgi:hypothetical protein
LLSPAAAFLINHDSAPIQVILQNGGSSLEIAQSDLSRFFLSQKNLQNLVQVQKLLSGKKKVVYYQMRRRIEVYTEFFYKNTQNGLERFK